MEPAAVDAKDAKELTQVATDSVRHVLRAYGLRAETPIAPSEELDPAEVVALIGFSGDALKGTLAIIAPADLIRRTCLPLQQGPNAGAWEVFDWAGELVNMMLGRIKVGLAARGVDIDSSTPRVMLAGHLRVLRSSQNTVCSTCFSVGDSQLTLWFDAVASQGYPLFPREPGADASLPEGDVAFFE
jgi:CheY-specific phosphatase CheX